jgi:predicted nucleotidyltransferase
MVTGGNVSLTVLYMQAPIGGGEQVLDQDDIETIIRWSQRHDSISEVWLFGSRVKGSSRPDSDIDLALVLTPPRQGHDWARGNYERFGDDWQRELSAMIGRHVSLTLKAEEAEPSTPLWVRADRSKS